MKITTVQRKKVIMYKRTAFAFREFIRFFKKEFKDLYSDIYVSIIYLLVISLNLAVLFNIKFLKEADAFQIEGNIKAQFFSKIYILEKYEIIFHIILIIISIAYYFYNKKKIKHFIADFNEELKLIKRLKGSDCEGRLVLSYLVIFINLFTVIITWVVGYYLYKLFSHYTGFYLLDFSCFKITLFITLLTLAESIGLISLYYLFWQRRRKRI